MTRVLRWKSIWSSRILFVVYILLLIGIILFKLPFYSPELSDGIRIISLIPFQGSVNENGVIGWREIIQNIIIFAPLGIYISTLKSKWSFMKKVFAVISLTFAFEVIQFIFALGRSDITDILGNTLGGIFGIGIYALLHKVFKNKTDKVVNMLAVIVTVCVVLRFAHLFYLSHFALGRFPLM